MKLKLTILALALCLIGSVASAQSFFKPLPPLKLKVAGVTDSSTLTANVIRPVANLASYGITNGSTVLLTGAGVSYQHDKYDASTGQWSVVYSINALAWYNVPLTGQAATIMSYGVAVGILNNLVLVGAAYNGSKVYATIGVGINFNNGAGLSFGKK